MTDNFRLFTASHSAVLELRGLTVEYASARGVPSLRAVDKVDLTIGVNETVGLVGESGSGKSTIGRAILGMTPVRSGSISFLGKDITQLSSKGRRKLSADLQVVFQDPFSSLNPTRTIGQSLHEMLRGNREHSRLKGKNHDDIVRSMLRRVGLTQEIVSRYPAQFSGGQRQRIAIARALMTGPRLVICDEAVSALDLSVQAQVLNLLGDLQKEFGVSYLFISHDLAVVRHVSQRIAVLYRGRIMELGPAAAVYNNPQHPYTQALRAAAPVPDPELQRERRSTRTVSVDGAEQTLPDHLCPFVTRCPRAAEICRTDRPPVVRTSSESIVACHHPGTVATIEKDIHLSASHSS